MHQIINVLDVEVTLPYEGDAGRGKHPTLYADVVCNLTLDGIRLWVLNDLGDSYETTTPCLGGWNANAIVIFRARLPLAQ